MSRSIGVALLCMLIPSPMAFAGTVPVASHQARWVVPDGKGTREIKAALTLDDAGVVLRSESGEILRSVPYESLRSVSYGTTGHRRWTSGLLVGTLVNPIGYALILTKSKSHYVTFLQDDAATVVKLEGSDYSRVLEEVEARTSRPAVAEMR
jgi:hypothetical protein